MIKKYIVTKDLVQQTLVDSPNPVSAAAVKAAIGSSESSIAILSSRMTTAEGNITALGNRMTTAEGSISSLGSRMTSAEGNITSATSRVSSLEGRMTTAEGKISAQESKPTTMSGTGNPSGGKNGDIYVKYSGSGSSLAVDSTWTKISGAWVKVSSGGSGGGIGVNVSASGDLKIGSISCTLTPSNTSIQNLVYDRSKLLPVISGVTLSRGSVSTSMYTGFSIKNNKFAMLRLQYGGTGSQSQTHGEFAVYRTRGDLFIKSCTIMSGPGGGYRVDELVPLPDFDIATDTLYIKGRAFYTDLSASFRMSVATITNEDLKLSP